MAGLKSSQATAMEPLRAALVTRAEARSAERRHAAEQEARATIADAGAAADAMLAEARSAGRADAVATFARGRGRRAARSVVLEAQGAVYQQLRNEACAAVGRLLSDPARRDALVALLRRELGEAAVIHPAPGGGMVADSPDGRHIDASSESLVDAATAALDLGAPWQG